MTHSISEGVWRILACSRCGQRLNQDRYGAECSACSLRYDYTENGAIDMRLKERRDYPLKITLGTPLLPPGGFVFEPLRMNREAEVDFAGLRAPHHLTREIMSYFPKAKTTSSMVLDLGCGEGIHRSVCERAGFEWVGLDYSSPQAPIIADAHSLPFENDAFDFILSVAVLEHIRYPFVVMQEAYRVLKPHGRFIGTVAFLEPFHGDSYYHHTALGIYNSLQYGGFRIEKIAPSEEWSVLEAQATMGLFPKMPQFLAHSLIFPLQILHKLWWKLASLLTCKANESVRITNTTGAFVFIAGKEVI